MKLYAADVDFRPIVEEFSLNGDFTDEQRAEAAAAVDHFPDDRIDATDIPFVTIDPAGSMDLDQAVHIAARPTGGFIVSYAIADVAAFVRPGSAVYAESLRRGQTLYLPDAPIRLHPSVPLNAMTTRKPSKNTKQGRFTPRSNSCHKSDSCGPKATSAPTP